MYSRNLTIENNKSFLLLGPRATGKSTWLSKHFPHATLIDLLRPELYTKLLAKPETIQDYITQPGEWFIIDEVQRIPELLNVAHLLIEKRGMRIGLTGSSARKLRQSGVNLLAGRALTYKMYPLTAEEIGEDFDLLKSLEYGHLPSVFSEPDPKKYLASYVQTYLKEEVQQEGLTRNLAAFSRFLQAASFSQASVLNISDVAREAEVERKVVENYFSILEDLMIAQRLQVFNKRAKRKLISHPKFYFFDVGVYRALRPAGPLDQADVIPGVSLETLVWQELRAVIDYHNLGFELFFWRAQSGIEVDFILYGESGLVAIEVKASKKVHSNDLKGLLTFKQDYPSARLILLYGGDDTLQKSGVDIYSAQSFLPRLSKILRSLFKTEPLI